MDIVTGFRKYGIGPLYGAGGSRWKCGHTGVDSPWPHGTEVCFPWKVTDVGRSLGSAFGLHRVLRIEDGRWTGTLVMVAHLSSKAPGNVFHADVSVGRVGSTGNSTGAHLHFQRQAGPEWYKVDDPMELLAKRLEGVIQPVAGRRASILWAPHSKARRKALMGARHTVTGQWGEFVKIKSGWIKLDKNVKLTLN